MPCIASYPLLLQAALAELNGLLKKRSLIFFLFGKAELHSLSPSNDAKLQEVQRSYGTGHEAALDMQNAIMKQMKRVATIQGETFTDDNIDPEGMDAVLHNLLRRKRDLVSVQSLSQRAQLHPEN